jgi:hypothetical protein
MDKRNDAASAWRRRRTHIIPPDSPDAWIRLVSWELWMGMVLFFLVALGARMIITAPDRVVMVRDLSPCYATPPAPPPCARTLYRGALNMTFSGFAGFIMLAIAAWFVWELWSITEPLPITDDFLLLLDQSFGHDWRDPRTWPWSRAWWAYGITSIGAGLTAIFAFWVLPIVTSRP